MYELRLEAGFLQEKVVAAISSDVLTRWKKNFFSKLRILCNFGQKLSVGQA